MSLLLSASIYTKKNPNESQNLYTDSMKKKEIQRIKLNIIFAVSARTQELMPL